MSDWLKKEDTLHERGENKQLLPQIITVEGLKDKPKIVALPLTSGKLKEIYAANPDGETKRDQDEDIIENYCLKPKYTKTELTSMKYKFVLAVAGAIVAFSTGTKDSEGTPTEDVLAELDEEIKKKENVA